MVIIKGMEQFVHVLSFLSVQLFFFCFFKGGSLKFLNCPFSFSLQVSFVKKKKKGKKER